METAEGDCEPRPRASLAAVVLVLLGERAHGLACGLRLLCEATWVLDCTLNPFLGHDYTITLPLFGADAAPSVGLHLPGGVLP